VSQDGTKSRRIGRSGSDPSVLLLRIGFVGRK
jgi:hypothetical protein